MGAHDKIAVLQIGLQGADYPDPIRRPTRHAGSALGNGHHLRPPVRRVTGCRHGATTRTANVAELLHREALWLVHCSHSVTDVHSRRIPVGMFKEVTTWVLQLLLKH